MQCILAVKKAFAELGYDIEWFTIAAKWGDPPGYSLILEPGAYGNDHERLCRCVDKHLAAANCEYENRLQTRRLRPMVYHEVPHGTWMAVRDKRLEERGGTVEQYKHRFLTSDTKFTESLRDLVLPQLT